VPASKPLDGVSVWSALLADTPSPRTEFLINIDPVDLFANAAQGLTNRTWAYRFRGCIGEPEAFCGDWKYVDTPVNASWYPTPTNASLTALEHSPALPALRSLVEYDGEWQRPILPVPISWDHVVGLYNLTADPGEHVNLWHRFPGVVAALVRKIEAFNAVAMQPCNVPGGTCAKQDVHGLLQAKLERAWRPWVKDEL
jgi:hypothetical protein